MNSNPLTFRLDRFEGPLDLLLHLIAKNKVSIYDIPIVQILDQYMEVLNQAQAMDMDVAGDFIAMAAQLVYIKSKMLLPRHEETPEDDPRAQLVEMLLEYQRIKLAAPYLREHGEFGRDIFTKSPEPLQTKTPVEYRHPVSDLVRAARNLLRRTERRIPPSAKVFTGIVGREPVPVGEKILQILNRFLSHTRLKFSRLFDHAQSRSEIVALFLAVLELSKTHRVMLEGEGDDLELRLTQPGEEVPHH